MTVESAQTEFGTKLLFYRLTFDLLMKSHKNTVAAAGGSPSF